MGDIAKESGISRQAVYLHFASRTELLVAATRYLDEVLAATSGVERLALYIECWGNYIPDIFGVAKALLLAQDTDEAAAAAWQDRMRAMRDGCRAAIEALHADGILAPEWSPKKATDALWTMLLVPNWEHLTIKCGWSTKAYVRCMKTLAQRTFVVDSK
jgi:AcrR family transcriptional regulator